MCQVNIFFFFIGVCTIEKNKKIKYLKNKIGTKGFVSSEYELS